MESVLIKRVLLFIFGCVFSRLLITYLVMKYSHYNQNNVIFGLISLIPAIGFAYIYLTGARKTGAEVFGDIIWWNNLRPIHSLLYFLFAILSIYGYNKAYRVLLLDVIIGFVMFINYHINN